MTDTSTSQPLAIYWDLPVSANGRLLFGPLEASHFMRTKWSADKNDDFRTAANSILDALAGRGSPDYARELFQKAVASARMA